MLLLLLMCFMGILQHPVVLGHAHEEKIVPDPPGTLNHSSGAISLPENAQIKGHAPEKKYDPDNASTLIDSHVEIFFPENARRKRYVAFLPPGEQELLNRKTHKKFIKKRSSGREVQLPAEAVEALKHKPLSYFSTSEQYNRDLILASHNKCRSKSNPPAANMLKMVWSEAAAKTAQAWAEKCIQGHSPSSARRIPGFRCGENIFLAAYKMSWDIVTDCWESEVVDFVFGQGSKNGAEIGHYTQLMWGPSNLMGCGVAECPNLPNKYNYVCHYCPAGNKNPIGYPYKKGKPCEDCPNSCENNLCKNPCPYQDQFVNCKEYKTGDTCGNDQSLINDCPAMCKCTKGEIK